MSPSWMVLARGADLGTCNIPRCGAPAWIATDRKCCMSPLSGWGRPGFAADPSERRYKDCLV